MDGLELSRLVKQEMPDMKIIVLSGYDEFEYAKEGISIGITDYLVKPVSGAQLLEAVKKVGKLVEEEQEQRQFLKTFERERLENTQLARQKFFRSLVSGNKSVSALLKEGREIGLELAANRYNILLFQIFSGGEMEAYSEEQNTVTRAIEEMTEKIPGALMVELGLEGWAFVLKETENRGLEEQQQEFLNQLQSTIRSYGKVEYFGGLGVPVGRLSELNRCFEEANRAFAYRYLKVQQRGFPAGELIERCGDFQNMTAVFATAEQTKEYLNRVLEAVLEIRETVSQKKYSSLLKDAKSFIEQNFDNEEISLNMTAASVNLSPNHFSTIFSQETGQTFIEFLTSVRMEKARELLRSTSMKTAEIAFAVGYRDPHYFSYLFKKTQECTPREFRAKA